ncbi:MAG: hypothetical protein NT098_03460 [Candidatus Parcubacteria bacterium]|nr:hypothetical protein [Candidatus Parcubacteria bacterium]
MDENDIDAVLKTAAHTHIPHNRHRPLNALSSLPSSKAQLQIGIKERIRHLAGAYISLATFIDDDDLAFTERNPKSKRTKAIYFRVIRNIEKAEKEINQLKIS